MKRMKMAAAFAATALAGGLMFAGSASASTIPSPAPATTPAVATPAGSFHIPVVPYPFSGSFGTTFSLYTLPACSTGATKFEVFLSTPGVEQDYTPPIGSTIILTSDDTGFLRGSVGANGALPEDPFTSVDFSASGLNGFVTAAGDYSLGLKCFSPTAITDVWWTTVHFNGAATVTNAPNWNWEPLG